MNYWAKVGLATVAVAALFGLYKWDEYRSAQNETLEKVAAKVLNFDKSKVRTLALQYNNVSLAFTRESATGEWKFAGRNDAVKPEQEAVSNFLDAVDGLNYSVAILDTEKVLTGSEADKKPYGLDKPRITIDITLDDKTTQQVVVGADMNIGSNTGGKFEAVSVFASSSSQKNILALNATTIGAFKKGYVDFRTKRITEIKVSDVKAFNIKMAAGDAIKATKSDKGWEIIEPRKLIADNSNISSFISSFVDYKAYKVIEKDALTPEQVAMFNAPFAVITISGDASKILQEIKIGKDKDSNYITMADGAIATFDSSKLKDFLPELKYFRDKKVLRDVVTQDITKIKTKSGKIFLKEGANWYPQISTNFNAKSASDAKAVVGATPTPAGKVANSDASDFFGDWEFMNADDIIDGLNSTNFAIYGLDKPVQEFWFEYADAKKAPEHIIIGVRVPKNDKMVYVKRASREAVFIVDATWLERLNKLDGITAK